MKKQNLLTGSLILIISAIISKFFGVFFKVPLTNMIGGDGIGLFSLAFSIFLPVFSICTTGISTAVSKVIANYSAYNDTSSVLKTYSVSKILFFTMGFVLTLIFILISPVLCRFTTGIPELLPCVIISAPCILLGCMTSVYRSFFEGMQNMIPTSVSQVIESVLKMISGLFFSKLFYENHTLICSFLNISDSENIAAAFGAMLGITFSCISSCFYMFIASFRATLKIQSKIDISCPSFADISKKLMCFFLPAALVALLSNISTITDLVTIKPLLKNSIANQSIYADIKTSEISVFIFGAYNGLAITVFNLVPSVTNMIGKSVLACTTQAVNSGNKAYISKCISSAVFSTSFIAMPLSLGILSLTKEILSILFKNAPSEVSVAVMPLKYLSFGIIFLSFTFPMFGIFQAVNKQNIPVFLMIIGGIIKFILNIVLIPIDSINISGAAIATTLSYFVIFVLSVIIIRKELDISYIFFKSVFEVLICSVLCAVCARGIFDISANYLRDEISLISGVIAGGIVYILSLWAMGYKSIIH